MFTLEGQDFTARLTAVSRLALTIDNRMGHDPLDRIEDTKGFGAYDRESIERFFHAAFEERGRLLEELAAARRRIAQAEAELAGVADEEFRSVRDVLESQRLLREEVRANERAVAAIAASAEAEAVRLVSSARAKAATRRDSTVQRPRPTEHVGPAGLNGRVARGSPSVVHHGRF